MARHTPELRTTPQSERDIDCRVPIDRDNLSDRHCRGVGRHDHTATQPRVERRNPRPRMEVVRQGCERPHGQSQ